MRVNTPDALFESSVPGLELLGRGKVRDIYAVSSDELLIVTTDRLSAYDVVMPDAVPGKGRILTRLSLFWFEMMSDIIDNHLTGRNIDEVIEDAALRDRLRDQSLIVKRLHPLPVEAVVRGYLIGSGWRDYQHSGQVCGIDLPSGLKLADRLPQTLFTPATKASVGEHDENVSFESISRLIGDELAGRVRDLSVAIYERAAAHAMDRGIIIADTKFEFGLDETGKLYLIDEVLTPDSSLAGRSLYDRHQSAELR